MVGRIAMSSLTQYAQWFMISHFDTSFFFLATIASVIYAVANSPGAKHACVCASCMCVQFCMQIIICIGLVTFQFSYKSKVKQWCIESKNSKVWTAYHPHVSTLFYAAHSLFYLCFRLIYVINLSFLRDLFQDLIMISRKQVACRLKLNYIFC